MFKWLAMLLAVVFCTGFVSCKDDDDDDNGASGNSIVGTWRMDFSVGYELMTFRSDGTGILIEYDGSLAVGMKLLLGCKMTERLF